MVMSQFEFLLPTDTVGTMKVDKVSFSDIARIHLKWKKTPYQANRVLAVMASMYSFAAKRNFIPSGFPAHGLEPDSKDNYRASRLTAIWMQANVTKAARVPARFS